MAPTCRAPGQGCHWNSVAERGRAGNREPPTDALSQPGARSPLPVSTLSVTFVYFLTAYCIQHRRHCLQHFIDVCQIVNYSWLLINQNQYYFCYKKVKKNQRYAMEIYLHILWMYSSVGPTTCNEAFINCHWILESLHLT